MKLVLYSLPKGVVTENWMYLAFPNGLVQTLALSSLPYEVITENYLCLAFQTELVLKISFV